MKSVERVKKRFERFILTALLLCTSGLPGCAPKDNVKQSEGAVDRFHQLWNESYFTAVYNNAHPGFRAAQAPQQTIAQLEYNRRFFGTFKSATRNSANTKSENSEKDITLDYQSTYEHGTAREVFTYRMTDGKPLLMNYKMLPSSGQTKR